VEAPTISQAAQNYLETVRQSRSENTARVYTNAISIFLRVLKEYWIEADTVPAANLSEDSLTKMLAYLKSYSSATEHLYVQAVKGFYEYLAAEKLSEVNLPRLNRLIKQRSRRSGQRLPQFPREDIERVLEFSGQLADQLSDNQDIRLRALRDRAFLLTLADTGLRVHEACSLRRADMDWNEGHAVIIGKGDKQALVRFSSRSLRAINDYLTARATIDGETGRPLSSLPLFARHDKGAGKKVKSITTTTGRNIVSERVRQALGDGAEGKITPHSFRHYFVTTVLRASGNLKLAQALARHASIQVTQRYAHLSDDELDRGYHDIFENH
jgi:site-specific recombinase XerD